MLAGPVDIEKNKKLYIYATIGDNEEIEIADISKLMENKELFSIYDKAFVFYVIFQ